MWPHQLRWRRSGPALPSFSVLASWRAWLMGSFLASRFVFLSLGLFTTNVCFWKPCFQAKQWGRDACFASAAQRRGQAGGWAGVPYTEEQCLLCSTPTPFLHKQRAGIPALDLRGAETLGFLDFKMLSQTTLLTSCIPSCKSPTSPSR